MSPTPAGVVITAARPDGTTEDVTKGVQALYDLVIQSMDWGSGFFSEEGAVPVARIAEFCGFEQAEEAQRYLDEARRKQRQRMCRHPSWSDAIEPLASGYVMRQCDECGLQRVEPRRDRLRRDGTGGGVHDGARGGTDAHGAGTARA